MLSSITLSVFVGFGVRALELSGATLFLFKMCNGGICNMTYDSTNSTIKRIGFVGNYLPRQCGIATFTTDLCEAIATEYSDVSCIALPVNDLADGF